MWEQNKSNNLKKKRFKCSAKKFSLDICFSMCVHTNVLNLQGQARFLLQKLYSVSDPQ